MGRLTVCHLSLVCLLAFFSFPLVLTAEDNGEAPVQPPAVEGTSSESDAPGVIQDGNATQQSVEESKEDLNSGQKWQKQMEQQRSKEFKSQQQSRSEYYKYAAPKNPNQPDYFKTGHPLQASPLKKNPLR